jgi:hypothetical protein
VYVIVVAFDVAVAVEPRRDAAAAVAIVVVVVVVKHMSKTLLFLFMLLTAGGVEDVAIVVDVAVAVAVVAPKTCCYCCCYCCCGCFSGKVTYLRHYCSIIVVAFDVVALVAPLVVDAAVVAPRLADYATVAVVVSVVKSPRLKHCCCCFVLVAARGVIVVAFDVVALVAAVTVPRPDAVTTVAPANFVVADAVVVGPQSHV